MTKSQESRIKALEVALEIPPYDEAPYAIHDCTGSRDELLLKLRTQIEQSGGHVNDQADHTDIDIEMLDGLRSALRKDIELIGKGQFIKGMQRVRLVSKNN